MSENATTLFKNLRELLEKTDLNIKQVANRAKVSYHKLRRFAHQGGQLSLVDAEKVHLELTGKSFIETHEK